jgi:hypothetical protein
MRGVLGELEAFFGLVISISSAAPRHLYIFMTATISLYETVPSYAKQSNIVYRT